MLIQAMMYYLLMAQCAVAFFLSIPYGNRACQRVVEWVDKSFGKIEMVRRGVQFSFFVIVLMFVQAVMQTRNYEDAENWTTETRNKQLLAQRDAYIAGFNLFILALLRLVYKNLASNNRMTASAEALKKQASGLQAEYTRLSDEKDKQDSDLETLRTLVKTTFLENKTQATAFDLETFLKTNSDLKSELVTTKKTLAEREKKTASLETSLQMLKKQAEAQGSEAAASLQMDAFNKLDAENKSLKEQLKALDLQSAGKDGSKKND